MAQPLARFCPRCGTETIANQKFCSKCGLEISTDARSTRSPEQAVDQPSRPSSGPTSKPLSRPVPKRPSTQVTPPSSEYPTKTPSRPTLEPLNDTSRPPSIEATLLEPSLDQEISLSPESPPDYVPPPLTAAQPSVPAVPSSPAQPLYPPVPQIEYQPLAQESAQPDMRKDPTDVTTGPSSLHGAIASMPTQMLSQSQAQKPPRFSIQTQGRAALQSLSTLLKPPLDKRRVGILLVLLVVLGGFILAIVEVLHVTATPGQPTITTTSIGTTVNYAGVDITVVNAQTSQSFLDDPHSGSNGMLRLQLSAQNGTSLAMKLPYETIAHVTLPDGKTLSPTYITSHENLAPNATQTNSVDFAVPQSVRVDQLIFHLGGVDEAQLDIPLNGHANIDQYASKTIHPNQQTSYSGLNWTLTTASLQFHIDGKQASKDMRYLILTLKVDNPLFEKVLSGSPYDYVLLKSGTTSIDLLDTTLPPSFEAGASGKVGTLTFLVPQDSTSFTLTLYNPQDGFDASDPIKFKI